MVLHKILVGDVHVEQGAIIVSLKVVIAIKSELSMFKCSVTEQQSIGPSCNISFFILVDEQYLQQSLSLKYSVFADKNTFFNIGYLPKHLLKCLNNINKKMMISNNNNNNNNDI